MDNIQDRLVELASQLVELKDQRTELERQLDEIKDKAKAVGDEFIQYSKNHDIDGVKVRGCSVGYAITPRTSIKDPEKAFQYFRDINMGHLIKETIHWQTLNTTVKELVSANQLDSMDAESIGLNMYDQEVVRIRRS